MFNEEIEAERRTKTKKRTRSTQSKLKNKFLICVQRFFKEFEWEFTRLKSSNIVYIRQFCCCFRVQHKISLHYTIWGWGRERNWNFRARKSEKGRNSKSKSRTRILQPFFWLLYCSTLAVSRNYFSVIYFILSRIAALASFLSLITSFYGCG